MQSPAVLHPTSGSQLSRRTKHTAWSGGSSRSNNWCLTSAAEIETAGLQRLCLPASSSTHSARSLAIAYMPVQAICVPYIASVPCGCHVTRACKFAIATAALHLMLRQACEQTKRTLPKAAGTGAACTVTRNVTPRPARVIRSPSADCSSFWYTCS